MDKNININVAHLFSRAIALHQSGIIDEAVVIYLTILDSDPNHSETLNMLGAARHQQGIHEEAIRLIGLSLKLNPRQPSALNNRGLALYHVQRYDEALASYHEAIALKPDYAAAFHNQGKALKELKRYDEALASYGNAITIKPDLAQVHNDLGVILYEMGRYVDALAHYETAIAFQPDYDAAYHNHGNALRQLHRYDHALASYAKAIELNPDCADVYNDQGVALHRLHRHDDALASYDKAIALTPGYAKAYYNRGFVLNHMVRYEEALASYEQAILLNPDMPYLMGTHLHTKMHLCDWRELDIAFDTLAKAIEAGKSASSPFPVLATPLSSLHQRRCSESHIRNRFPPSTVPLWRGERYSHDRIRIGYFSSEFRNHPLAHLMVGFFELHDRSKFDVTAFSFGAAANDPIRKRLEGAFEHFIDVSAHSEAEIATLARRLEIDIAVDLNGFTGDARNGVFAMRPAPVQVNYLGYPGTIGAEYMDYLIADSTIIPEDHKRYFTENIVHLPHSYWVTDSARILSEQHVNRRQVELPENGFVFCCFNNSYKITPDVFDIWMRLLHKVDGSVLWLLGGNPASARNLLARARSRGVADGRLVFAKRINQDDHLLRHRLADLFVDTFYCNAHTTASDALWEGLPVLTCLGHTFAGRVAASLLRAANLPELITHSHEEYESLALELATNPQKLLALRKKLVQNRRTCPLFNTALFTRHCEDAYVQMWQRAQEGLVPDDIYVAVQEKPADITNKNNNIAHLFSRAIALHQSGEINDAVAIYLTILESDSNHADTLNMLGTARLQQGIHEEAIRLIGLSLKVNPRQPSALNNRGLAFHHVQRYDEALASYHEAIVLKADYAAAFHNKGKALKQMKRYDEAFASYGKAIVLKPDFAQAHNDLGVLLQEMSRNAEARSGCDMFSAAAASYRQAILFDPHFAAAHKNLANVLRQLKSTEEPGV